MARGGVILAMKATASLAPWLCQAIRFSPSPSVLPPWRPRAATPTAFVHSCDGAADYNTRRRGGESSVTLRLSQSVNDNVGGFHYDQEPRGTSYISQVSKRDLWERRQMRGPRSWQARQRRPAPNSRGAFTPQQSYENEINGGGGSFNTFKDNVSANLKSMTDLLKEMQESQSSQTMEVQALTLKVADMAERLSMTEVKKRMTNQSSSGEIKDRNFGTSLDGEFHQKIKDVIDEFDMVDAANKNRASGGAGLQSESYYRTKIAQLEAKINKIDEVLKETEEKVNSQMEYVDMVVNQRFDDMDEAGFDVMSYMEEGPPPPPPIEELPPPPPSRPQEGYDGNPYMDDGRTYYQERNYNVPNAPPPPPQTQDISSSQKQQSDKSANERSGGHHYSEKNTSFISAFSRADNEQRRQFQPFGDSRRTPNRTGPAEQLPRGPRAPLNRRFIPPPPLAELMLPGPMLPEYFEEPYFDEDAPIMEEEYFYEDMYEF